LFFLFFYFFYIQSEKQGELIRNPFTSKMTLKNKMGGEEGKKKWFKIS